MPEDPRAFLGRGWSFPFRFTFRSGGVSRGTEVAQDVAERHIEDSILQILGTSIGTRVIRRDFGSDLRGIVFEPNDPTLDSEIDFIVRNAIERWEPRVIVGPISTDRTDFALGRLDISVQFTIIKTNVTRNLVFPYFLTPDQQRTFSNPGI